MTIEQLRDLLHARHGSLMEIARVTGVKHRTIRDIRDGVTQNPRIDHFSALAAYFGETNVPVPPR